MSKYFIEMNNEEASENRGCPLTGDSSPCPLPFVGCCTEGNGQSSFRESSLSVVVPSPWATLQDLLNRSGSSASSPHLNLPQPLPAPRVYQVGDGPRIHFTYNRPQPHPTQVAGGSPNPTQVVANSSNQLASLRQVASPNPTQVVTGHSNQPGSPRQVASHNPTQVVANSSNQLASLR